MYTFYMIADIEEPLAREFSEWLSTIPDKSEVTIQVLSHGGLVFVGLGMSQMIAHAQSRGVKFTANVWGIAASAASDIILSCDIINIAQGAKIMIHAAYGGTDESIEEANKEQLAIIRRRIPDYKAKDLREDHWFDAQEAVECGLADSIITTAANSEARALKLAAYYNPNMEEIMKDKAEIIEQVEEREEKHSEEVQGECGEDNNKSPKAADIEDLMEALIQRIDQIDHRLAVLEGEGKKQDEEGEVSASARRAALLARINSICAPVSPAMEKITPKAKETAEESDARCKALYKNFDQIVLDEIRRRGH